MFCVVFSVIKAVLFVMLLVGVGLRIAVGIIASFNPEKYATFR